MNTTTTLTRQPDETVDDVQFLLGYSTAVVPADVQAVLDTAAHIERRVVRSERGFGFGVTLEHWRVVTRSGGRGDFYVFLGGYDEAPVVTVVERAAALAIGSAVGYDPDAES